MRRKFLYDLSSSSCRRAWYVPCVCLLAIHGCIQIAHFLFLFSFSFAAVATRIPTAATATVSSAMFVSGTRHFDTRCNWYEKLALKNRYHFLVPVSGTCVMGLSCKDIARQSCGMVPRWRLFDVFFACCIFSKPRAARFRPAF